MVEAYLRAVRREELLAFVTYLRRFTRGVTTLAALGADEGEEGSRAWAERQAERMDRLGEALAGGTPPPRAPGRLAVVARGLAGAQRERMERQMSVLERSSEVLLGRG